MKLPNKKVFWLLGFLIFASGLAAFYFTFRSDLIAVFEDVSKKEDIKTAKPVTFIEENSDKSYIIDLSIHDNDQVLPFLIGTNVDSYKKNVNITKNLTNYISRFSEDGNVMAAYNYQFDDENQILNITIYLNDSLDDDKRIYYLNRAYLTALLSAAEQDKSRGSNYQPNWEEAGQTAFRLVADMYDSNSYFINYND